MSSPTASDCTNEEHLVLLVHGMNTYAQWTNDIKAALQDKGFVVSPISYGFFGAPRFLAFPFLRRQAIGRVLKGVNTAVRVYRDQTSAHPKRISVISHSFGTWLIAHVLKDNPGIKLYRIIFCGSVVREDFDFDPILHQFTTPILNHIGTADYWPALGESAGWGYGSIGSNGINHSAVENRWHQGFKHSDFFTKEFGQKFWVPFLEGASPASADGWQRLPNWIRAVTMLPLRWLILGTALVMIFAPIYWLTLTMGGSDAIERARCTIIGIFTSDTLRRSC